jgi:hypothetical protein
MVRREISSSGTSAGFDALCKIYSSCAAAAAGLSCCHFFL